MRSLLLSVTASWVLALGLFLGLPSMLPAQAGSQTIAASPAKVHADVVASTVAVIIDGQVMGTGWIIDSDKRWIITNHHVVARRDGKVHAEVKIAFPEHKDGELITDVDYYERDDAALTRSGRILHADVRRDLAIVAVPTLPKGARALRVASKSARPGSTVYAVGNANGYDALWVLRKGTVHVVARTMEAKGRIYTVASDVALNPGDSGGPLVNEQCELVGVNFRGRGEHAKVAYSIDVRELKQFLADAPKIMAPESAGDFLLRARHHKDHRRFDDALADLDEALRLDDRSAEAYEEISWVHNEIGNYQEGMDAATRAIEINPRSSFAYNERAFAHEKRQEWANAVADLDKVVILDPKNGYAWAKLGRDLVNVRDHQRAVIVFNEAIRLHQKTGMVYEGRGDCYAALEEYANARADYEVALRLSPPGSIERERINDKLDELDRKIP